MAASFEVCVDDIVIGISGVDMSMILSPSLLAGHFIQ
jgi:hypothetical protein